MSRPTRTGGRGLPELFAAGGVVLLGLLVTVVVTAFFGLVGGLLPLSSTMVGLVLALVVAGGLLATAVGAWLAYAAVARTRQKVTERLHDAQLESYARAKRLESVVPFASQFGLSSWLAPDDETVLAALKRRYVDGTLDERGFEAQVERLLDETTDTGSVFTTGDQRWRESPRPAGRRRASSSDRRRASSSDRRRESSPDRKRGWSNDRNRDRSVEWE